MSSDNFAIYNETGGGFFVEDNGVWYLQGIVSSSLLTNVKTCDVNKYTLYTKVNEFLSWIDLKDKAYEIELNGLLVALIIGDDEEKT